MCPTPQRKWENAANKTKELCDSRFKDRMDEVVRGSEEVEVE